MTSRTIDRLSLLGVLKRIIERKPYISDYRKNSSGKIVRFIDWRTKRR